MIMLFIFAIMFTAGFSIRNIILCAEDKNSSVLDVIWSWLSMIMWVIVICWTVSNYNISVKIEQTLPTTQQVEK